MTSRFNGFLDTELNKLLKQLNPFRLRRTGLKAGVNEKARRGQLRLWVF